MKNMDFNKLLFFIPFLVGVLLSTAPLASSNDNFISTSASADFGINSIQSIIDDYSYINYSQDNLLTITGQKTNYKTIELINPLGIKSDCGTVEANLDETLTILLKAYENSIEQMPQFLMKNIHGFPDIRNPKAVFEYIYDITTTLVCTGQSALLSGVEQGLNAPFIYLKNKFKTKTNENITTSDSQQINSSCKRIAELDQAKSKETAGENLAADTQSEGDSKVDFIHQLSENEKKCKAEYDGYKNTINLKIKMFKLLEEKNRVALKSSCDVLQNEKIKDAKKPKDERMGYSKVIEINPIYLSNLQPQSVRAKFSCIESNIQLETDSAISSEIRIDRQCIKNTSLVNVPITPYNPSINSSMASPVYKLGYDYSMLLNTCISPKSMKQVSSNITDAKLKEYSDTCDIINITQSPFPIQLSDPSKDTIDFTQILLNKKAICDLTWFNLDNDQYIIDTIGYATMALDKIRSNTNPDHYPIGSPNLADLRAATKAMILDDYCDKKLVAEIAHLEKEYIKNNITGSILVSRDAKGVFIKAPAWRNNEVYVTPNTPLPVALDPPTGITTTPTTIHKICEKSPFQEEYYIATTDGTTSGIATIMTIAADNIDGLIDELGFDTPEEAPIEHLLWTKYDTEMLCDKIPGLTSCELDKLSCAINWTEISDRKDYLLDNPNSTNKDEDGNADKLGDYAAYEKRKFELDKKSAPSQRDFEFNEIRKGRKQQISAIVDKFDSTIKNNFLFIDLNEIEFQSRLNNLRF